MLKSINFEEGVKTYLINDDENRMITISTADYSLITRFQEAEKAIKNKAKEYDKIKIKPDGSADTDTEEAIAAIKDLTEFIESQINYIFNADVAGVVFNGQSCLSTWKGVPLYERFLNAVIPEIEKDLKAEVKASQQRINKYSGNAKYKKATGKR